MIGPQALHYNTAKKTHYELTNNVKTGVELVFTQFAVHLKFSVC